MTKELEASLLHIEFNDHTTSSASLLVGVTPPLLTNKTLGKLQAKPKAEFIITLFIRLVDVQNLQLLSGQTDIHFARPGVLKCIADQIGNIDSAKRLRQGKNGGFALDRNIYLFSRKQVSTEVLPIYLPPARFLATG